MAYIHKKKIGDKTYYSFRVSLRKGDKVIAKDICQLGNDISKIKISELEKNYKDEIRKSYKTIKKFLESETHLKKVKKKDLKKQKLLTKDQLSEIEAAKSQYTRFLRLEKATQKDFFENFLLRFAVNSTSIEGNTITMKEAAKLFREDIVPKDRTAREVFDLTNTRKVFFELLEKKPKISGDLIVEIHDRLLENIDKRKGIRNHDIHIFGQPFNPSPARYVKKDIEILLDWMKKSKLHPFVKSILFHHKFESIHPFSDGNGRTGRMIMNLLLMNNNYPPIVVDRRDRKKYLDAMNKCDKAIKKDLRAVEGYESLINFMISQMKKSFWDIFLF